MPYALLISGLVLLIAGVRDKSSELYDLLDGDFTGKNNFIAWVVAILVIGSLGYIEALKSLSRAFLLLIVIVMFLTRGGFFEQFQKDIIGA